MSKHIADTILEQIRCGRGVDGSAGTPCLMAWGARAFRWHPASEEKRHLGALSFRVSGFLFKGVVQIELAYSDTYRIRLLKQYDGDEVKLIEDVYFEDLTTFIDREVEHPADAAEYQRLNEQAVYRL